MSLYTAYFNKKLGSKPYASESEYLKDLLALVDMGLIHLCTYRALLQKNTSSEQVGERMKKNLHAREWLPPEMRAGVYMSPSESVKELSEYVEKVEKPPETFQDADIRSEMKQAESHILSRLAFTQKKGGDFAIVRIFENFGLSKAERSFFLLALAPCIEARYESIFEYLQGAEKTQPTLRLAFSFCELYGTITTDEKQRLTGLRGSFFEYLGVPDASVPASPMARAFCLSRHVFRHICGLKGQVLEFSPISEQNFASDNLPPMLVRKELGDIAANFIRDWGPHAEKRSDCRILHIYGEDGNGKRLTARHGAAINGYNLILVDTVYDSLKMIHSYS